MSGDKNDGIVISGGTVNAGALAVGPGASAVQQTMLPDQNRLSEIDALLKQLRQGIESHKDKLQEPDDSVQAVQLLQDEIKKEKPNKLTVRSVLAGLKDSVKTVAELAPLVEGASKLISLFVA